MDEMLDRLMTTTSPAASAYGAYYDRTTIALHWLTALLVFGLWALAESEDFVPKPGRHVLWSVHIALGATLVLVLLGRLAWRTTRGIHLVPADAGMLGKLSTMVHWLLYALVATAVALGIANTLARGWDFGGVITIPSLAHDRALRRSINGWHETAANATLVVAALHAAAALLHHYVLRDNVLRRMLPSRARG
jgi:cytochrome b561